jgi:hypothetical protein
MDAEKNSISHPDENLLTAFAEQAVTPQERQMVLEHLSSCARCREILFLMQEAEPVPAVVVGKETEAGKVVPWRRPLLWGYCAAIVVIALGSLSLIHRMDKDQHASTMAAVNALQSKPPVVTPSTPQSESETKQLPAPTPDKQEAPPRMVVPKSLQQIHEQATSTQKDEAASTVTEAGIPLSDKPSVQDVPNPQSVGGGSLNRSFVTANSPEESQPGAPAATSPIDDGLILGRTAKGTLQPRAVFRVEDGKLLRCESGSNCVVRPLPQMREASAVVSQKNVALALDKNGSLFLSKNTGESWQPVPVQWAGQARDLHVAGEKEYFAMKSAGTLSGVSSPSTLPRRRMTIPVFTLTNDKGETWYSLDWGRTWQRIDRGLP